MSKASQRKLAKLQKRSGGSKGPSQEVSGRVLAAYGSKMLDKDPRAYWKFASGAATPSAPHRDDSLLVKAFESASSFLSFVDAAANVDGEHSLVCPGVLFRFDQNGKPIGAPCAYGAQSFGTSLDEIGPHGWLGHLFEYLADGAEALLWATGLVSTTMPLGCWVLSKNGGAAAWLLVGGDWLKMSNPSVLNIVVEQTRQLSREGGEASHLLEHPSRAEVMGERTGAQDDYLHDLVNAACDPFLDLVGCCFSLASELRSSHVEHGLEVEKKIGAIKQKTTLQIETVKKRNADEADRLRCILEKTKEREAQLMAKLHSARTHQAQAAVHPSSSAVAQRMLAFA